MNVKIVVIFVAVYLVGSVLSDCGACGENEVCNTCGSPCVKTCANTNPICPAVCTGPKCQCTRGYVRNSDGKCILQRDCPPKNKQCGVNEEYRICASACTPTCDNPSPVCTMQCVPPACQCVQGYVRNSDNVCIALDECPAN